MWSSIPVLNKITQIYSAALRCRCAQSALGFVLSTGSTWGYLAIFCMTGHPTIDASTPLISCDQVCNYRPVFVVTDDFDTSYLFQLQQGLDLLDDSLYLTVINDLAYYWHTRNLDRATAWAESGLKRAASSGNTLLEGRLQITQGAILLRDEKLDSAELVLSQAEEKVTVSDLAFLYTQMGYVMERRGLLDNAADYALKSLHLGDSLNDLKARALAYSDLANLFWKQSKFDQGLEHGLRSVKLFDKRGIDDLDFSFTLYVVGNLYLSKKVYDQALQFFRASNIISERYGFDNNLSDTYISLVDLYTEIKEFDKAETAGREAVKYAELLDNNFLLMRSWLSIGRLQNLNNQPVEAISSIEKCLRIATDQFGDDFFLQLAYRELSRAQAALGNFQEAYLAYTKYEHFKDNVFTAEADRRIAQLQTEFEVEQKESIIASQVNRLAQQKRVQWLSTGFVILLLGILIVIVRSFVNKKRLNRKLEILNSDLEKKNAELDKRNAENELLLKEIHHRVKNNLEVVSSLLELQSAQIEDVNMQDMMLASQNRVQSMGIIHQKLYQGKNLASIEMRDYFINLGESVVDSFQAQEKVEISYDMPELELDVDTAVPVGLIVNELLTNALKYAFPNGGRGNILISLKKDKGGLYLQVKDDGIGKSAGSAPQGTGFGSQLVELLTKQLNGVKEERNEEGTTVTFYFRSRDM